MLTLDRVPFVTILDESTSFGADDLSRVLYSASISRSVDVALFRKYDHFSLSLYSSCSFWFYSIWLITGFSTGLYHRVPSVDLETANLIPVLVTGLWLVSMVMVFRHTFMVQPYTLSGDTLETSNIGGFLNGAPGDVVLPPTVELCMKKTSSA